MSLLNIIHYFHRFLGTSAGDLLKRSFELVLLTFASYMVASEWLHTKSKDLKYLLIGFGSLAMEKLIASLFLFSVVFGGLAVNPYKDYISLAENFLEITALILISTAFLYPLHKKCGISLGNKAIGEFLGMSIVFIFAAAIAFGIIPLPLGTRRRTILASMEIVKFIILWFPIVMFIRKNELTIYNKAVAIAFCVYSITPFLNTINWLLYITPRADLAVLAHPFPFIAVVLFTRVLFLKLVNKATIKEELINTKKKYVREKSISTMKDEFVSTVSHELRTPLTSISLYLNLLLSGKFGSLNEKQQEVVQTMTKESSRLNNLINNILNLSRFEKNKETINTRATNLHKLVSSCLYPHLTEEKQIRVINNVPKDVEVLLDQDQFKQVIINLLTNSINHTDQGGSITFTARNNPEEISFSITDTGRGISPDALPYIFDKFYQAEGHMVRKTGGIGLGLAIVKKIVMLHNGKITVQSELNKGTTFTITLPLNKQSQPITQKTA